MKKDLSIIPMIIFPYSLLIFCGTAKAADALFPNISEESFYAVLYALMRLFYIGCPICAVITSISAAKEKISPYKAAKHNLIIKAAGIPAYALFFFPAFWRLFADVFSSGKGIGYAAAPIIFVLIYISAIMLSGICSVGYVINMYKSGAISKKYAVITGILSFIFCADLLTAIVLFVTVKCRKNRPELPQENLL